MKLRAAHLKQPSCQAEVKSQAGFIVQHANRRIRVKHRGRFDSCLVPRPEHIERRLGRGNDLAQSLWIPIEDLLDGSIVALPIRVDECVILLQSVCRPLALGFLLCVEDRSRDEREDGDEGFHR